MRSRGMPIHRVPQFRIGKLFKESDDIIKASRSPIANLALARNWRSLDRFLPSMRRSLSLVIFRPSSLEPLREPEGPLALPSPPKSGERVRIEVADRLIDQDQHPKRTWHRTGRVQWSESWALIGSRGVLQLMGSLPLTVPLPCLRWLHGAGLRHGRPMHVPLRRMPLERDKR